MRSFEDVRCKGNLDPSTVQTSAIKLFELVNTISWNWIIFWNMQKWIIIINIVILNVKKFYLPILQIISSVLVDGLPCYNIGCDFFWRFPEQKSERIHLKKGKYYYLEAYQKADKLADCASVAVELPSGHFEGPIKRVHLSWRLPGEWQ